MKKPYAIITILLGLVIGLSIGNAFLQNMLSTSGIFVSKAEREINLYKTQNAILIEELLSQSSLTAVAQKANQVGFTSENALIVLGTSRPLAKR